MYQKRSVFEPFAVQSRPRDEREKTYQKWQERFLPTKVSVFTASGFWNWICCEKISLPHNIIFENDRTNEHPETNKKIMIESS